MMCWWPERHSTHGTFLSLDLLEELYANISSGGSLRYLIRLLVSFYSRSSFSSVYPKPARKKCVARYQRHPRHYFPAVASPVLQPHWPNDPSSWAVPRPPWAATPTRPVCPSRGTSKPTCAAAPSSPPTLC